MKIKILLLVAVVGLGFASCDSIKDLTAVDVDTTLKVDVTLDDSEAVALKSASLAGNEIVGSGTLNLNDNDDVKAYIAGIRGITLSDAIGKISGIDANDEITNLKVSATLKGKSYSLYDGTGVTLTAANASSIQLLLDEAKKLIDALDAEGYDNDIAFSVTGHSALPVKNRLKLKMELPSTVSYSPL